MTVEKGLRDIIVCESSLSWIDGKEGRLSYVGYDIHDLAENSTYEETVYLLWNLRLPTEAELAGFRKELAGSYALPKEILKIMHLLAHRASGMEVIRTVVSALGAYDPNRGDGSVDANRLRALRLTAQLPTVVAAFDQLRNNRDPVTPDPDLSVAANFLYMLRGEKPSKLEAGIFDTCLVLHAEHDLNASTFSARVTASTESDMYSSITSAIGTLRGPLHGGANRRVMEMLMEIGEPGMAAAFVKDALARKKKIMGFGHAVYRVEDPRARHLRRFSQQLAEKSGNPAWFQISQEVQKTVEKEKGLFPNVDFYAASVYHYLGIPRDLFTTLFACSRMAGWTAHVLAQLKDNRLIRPASDFVGEKHRKFVPLEHRK